jgi:hypothetical protein
VKKHVFFNNICYVAVLDNNEDKNSSYNRSRINKNKIPLKNKFFPLKNKKIHDFLKGMDCRYPLPVEPNSTSVHIEEYEVLSNNGGRRQSKVDEERADYRDSFSNEILRMNVFKKKLSLLRTLQDIHVNDITKIYFINTHKELFPDEKKALYKGFEEFLNT